MPRIPISSDQRSNSRAHPCWSSVLFQCILWLGQRRYSPSLRFRLVAGHSKPECGRSAEPVRQPWSAHQWHPPHPGGCRWRHQRLCPLARRRLSHPDGPLINPHDRCGSARQRSGTASPGGRPGGPGLEPSAAAQDRLSGAQPHPSHRPAALSLLPGWSSDQKPVDSAAGLRQYTDNV